MDYWISHFSSALGKCDSYTHEIGNTKRCILINEKGQMTRNLTISGTLAIRAKYPFVWSTDPLGLDSRMIAFDKRELLIGRPLLPAGLR